MVLLENKHGFVFDNKQYAILWISSRELSKKNFLEIRMLIEEYFRNNHEVYYFRTSWVFGKYDIAIEFYASSARVSSYFACEILKKIRDRLHNIEICSSLVLAKEIINISIRRPNFKSRKVIKAYSFLNFCEGNQRMGENTKKALNAIREIGPHNMKLLFNASSYSLILIINEDSYEKTYLKLIEFKEKLGDSLYESSTFFTLEYDKNGIKKDIRGNKEIPAIIFVKQRQGKSLQLEFSKESYESWFYDEINGKIRFHGQLRRVGWYDTALGIVKSTLHEIVEEIFKLRSKNNGDKHLIHHTSTLLLFERINGEDDK